MREITQEPKRSKTPFILGCCGGGCLAVVIGIIGMFFYVANFISNLQEPTPSVQKQEVNDEQLSAVQDRYVDYKERVERGEVADSEEFVLTEEEINNAIAGFTADMEDGPRVNVKLDGDVATGEVSIPIKQDDGSSKWINGEAEFTVTLENKKLDIRLKRLTVKGKAIPDSVMEGFKKENLAKDINNDPQMKKDLEKIEKIEIRDSKVYVKLKKPDAPEAGATPETPADNAPDAPQ